MTARCCHNVAGVTWRHYAIICGRTWLHSAGTSCRHEKFQRHACLSGHGRFANCSCKNAVRQPSVWASCIQIYYFDRCSCVGRWTQNFRLPVWIRILIKIKQVLCIILNQNFDKQKLHEHTKWKLNIQIWISELKIKIHNTKSMNLNSESKIKIHNSYCRDVRQTEFLWYMFLHAFPGWIALSFWCKVEFGQWPQQVKLE